MRPVVNWNRERRANLLLTKTGCALQSGALEQIVGRERNQRACHRQLARNVVVSRRVNSTVRRLPDFNMDVVIRITLSVLFVGLTTATIASGQTSSELRAKYGAPLTVELENNRVAVERFLVRPAIQMTIRYTSEGDPCEAVLEPVPNSTPKTGRAEHAPEGDFMVTTEVIKVINELLPPERRGKKINEGMFNGGDPQMKLHHLGCTGMYFVSFEHAMVDASSWCWGGTFRATIHWGKTSCRGQTMKPKDN